METSLITYMIVCPLVFMASFMDAIAGGGGLISMPAYLLAGTPMHFALGTNKLSSSLGTVISTFRYIRRGYVHLLAAASSVLFALLGASIGAKLTLSIDEKILSYGLVIILPFLAIYLFSKKDFGTKTTTEEKSTLRIVVLSILAAFIVGAYDGFYGPGTGTFLIIIYTTWVGFDMQTAAGNAKVVNLSSNIAAVITFLINGKVLIPLGLTAAIFSIAGHYIGSGLVIKNGHRIIKPFIFIILFILFIKVVVPM